MSQIVLYFSHTVCPKKYAHGFVVLCFVVVMQSFMMNSHEVFIHIHQGCFAGTGAIVRLPQCQWSKPGGYGRIGQCITTTKHSKAKTVCIFLGIYCSTLILSIYIDVHVALALFNAMSPFYLFNSLGYNFSRFARKFHAPQTRRCKVCALERRFITLCVCLQDFSNIYAAIERGSLRSIDEYSEDIIVTGEDEEGEDSYAAFKGFDDEKSVMPFGKAVTRNRGEISIDRPW